jgi:hypothetical protein
MTQPTQDPWGNNQQPPTPPQPTPQPYVFPQPGYGPQPQPPVYPQQQQPPPVYYQQPGYPQQPQQQPGLWNPSGVYGGVPEPKKNGIPWWGWLIIVVAALIVISGVLTVNTKSQIAATTTQAAAVVPTAPLDSSGANVSNATATAYAAKVYANLTAGAVSQQTTSASLDQPSKAVLTSASTPAPPVSKSKDIGVKVAGPGQELIGQGGTEDGLKVNIISVDRYSQLTNYDGKIIQSQGVFLVVAYDLENQSSKPQSIVFMSLIDGNGRTFNTSSNFDAIGAVAFSGNYKTDISIQPSFKGKGYSVFEVPAEASNFKIKLGF